VIKQENVPKKAQKNCENTKIVNNAQVKLIMESFKDVPDPIEEINILKIECKNGTVIADVQIRLPNDNNLQITHIRRTNIDSSESIIFECEKIIKMSFVPGKIQQFEFRAINSEGESDVEKTFKIYFNAQVKGDLYFAGDSTQNQIGIENLNENDKKLIDP
jgi:hypothetical protein